MGGLRAPPQPDLHLPLLLKKRGFPLLRQSKQLLGRNLEKVQAFQLQQVHGNLCHQQLPPAPKLEAPQNSCSLR